MKNVKLLVGLGLLGGGYYLFNRKKQTISETIESVIITPKDVSANFSNVLTPKIDVILNCYNPAPLEVTITKIYGSLKFNTIDLGTFSNYDSVKIGAKTDSDISVSFAIKGTALINSIISLGRKQIKVNVTGEVEVNNIPIPYQKTLVKSFNFGSIFGGGSNGGIDLSGLAGALGL
jgi:LEA14-like dessication related protein